MVINPIVFNDNGRGSDIFSQNLDNGVIHLVGEINDEMAASIIAQLLYLEAKETPVIQLYINSPGGSVTAGMAIYDTMQSIKAEVITICVGNAASMGAVILSGGQKGKRTILKHGQVMIHQPSTGISGQADDILITAEHIKQTKSMLNGILADNCGKAIEEIEKDTNRDYWMRANEALEYGIVDKIL